MYYILISLVFLPLISSLFGVLFPNRLRLTTLVPIFSMGFCTIASIVIFIHSGIEGNIEYIKLAEWINQSVFWCIYVDQLTAIMLLLISLVSLVVHIYSIGYMEDKNLQKFLSYLSLFTFFMFVLVSSSNFLQLFFGWEGVGLCSYLLIGFYYQKDSANNAAFKAFITNRVGDLGFVIAIMMIAIYANSFDFESLFILSDDLSRIYIAEGFSVLDTICLMLLVGCMAKSAQIGLHIWLPDAMEGPTPVSALIHAATMVTAGIFLIARCSFIFEKSIITLQLITIIGAITCLFGALVAITQNDIKKIIAYSTCSQLGYMFFACGVGAFSVSIFHLVTHGFFKALLFLSAGSIIHTCRTQNITDMGGLYRKMPITYANFWIGSLSIIGIFPFSGFYSKDLIIESVYMNGGGLGYFAFIIGLLVVALTAIYSMKIIILVFHGNTNLKPEIFKNISEVSNIMNIPLILLTCGALFSGMFAYYILDITGSHGFFRNAIFMEFHEDHVPILIQILPMIISLIGIILSIYVYKTKPLSNSLLNKFYYILERKFFFDELIDMTFCRFVYLASNMSNEIDKQVNRIVSRITSIISISSRVIRNIQTGYIFDYISYILCFVLLCITFFTMQNFTYNV